MLIIHDEELTRQLEALAAHENRPVEDVLKALLRDYSGSALEPHPHNTSTWLAANIESLAFETSDPIDPEQADEILRSEFGEALWKRMNDAIDADTDR